MTHADSDILIETGKHAAIARQLGMLMETTDKDAIHPSYQRLMYAAERLRGVTGESSLTSALHSTDQQRVNNWQRRGVSKDGALDAERFIGCPATWVLDGKMPPCDAWEKLNLPAAEQEKPVYEREDIRELRELAARMDRESVKAITSMLRKLNIV